MNAVNYNISYSPTGNTQESDRAEEIAQWDTATAIKQAEDEGMTLSNAHLEVLDVLRDIYVKNGWPKKTHELTKTLDHVFEEKGGNKYLHQLFPDGPVNQGTRLAGLPKPTVTTDESFGTAH